MKVLLLGATGYIGSVVAERLAVGGHTVAALVPPGTDAARLPAGSEVRHGDLRAPATLTAAVTADVDAVMNLATPLGDERVDTTAHAALLDALSGSGRPFLYTSGTWVLGTTGPGVADETSPADPVELVAYRPRIEQQVRAAAARGVRAIVVRPGIAHGRGGGIPALLVAQARSAGVGRYIGSPDVTWPMVHVDDLADLLVLALERAEPGTLLHAVAEPAVAVVDLAAAAASAAGVTGTAVWPVADARTALGVPFADALATSQQVSGARARLSLGWRPWRPGAVTDLAYRSYRASDPVPA